MVKGAGPRPEDSGITAIPGWAGPGTCYGIPAIPIHCQPFPVMIYIARDGKQAGPYTVEQLGAMLAAGKLRPTDMAWWEGCADWVPLESVPGVAGPAPAPEPVPAPAPVVQYASLQPQTYGQPQAYAQPQPAPAPAPVASAYAPPRASLAPAANNLGVSAGTVEALRQTRPWVLLIAIASGLMVGLFLVGGLLSLAGEAAMEAQVAPTAGSAAAAASLRNAMTIASVTYILVAAICLFPVVRLFKYASAISRLNRTGSVRDLEDALNQQKSYWKFVGALTLVGIIINLVILVLFGGAVFTAISRGVAGPSAPPPPPPPALFPAP